MNALLGRGGGRCCVAAPPGHPGCDGTGMAPYISPYSGLRWEGRRPCGVKPWLGLAAPPPPPPAPTGFSFIKMCPFAKGWEADENNNFMQSYFKENTSHTCLPTSMDAVPWKTFCLICSSRVSRWKRYLQIFGTFLFFRKKCNLQVSNVFSTLNNYS